MLWPLPMCLTIGIMHLEEGARYNCLVNDATALTGCVSPIIRPGNLGRVQTSVKGLYDTFYEYTPQDQSLQGRGSAARC